MSQTIKPVRRKFINAAAIGLAACGTLGMGYGLSRGFRFPPLSLEPHPLPSEFKLNKTASQFVSQNVIQLSKRSDVDIAFRAFSPEPTIIINNVINGEITLSLNNVLPEAELASNADVTESINGINRHVTISTKSNQTIELSWKLPFNKDFTFASIGDSGGDKELEWCLQRAHQLGAKFLLHLGDFNYQSGDYDRSVKLFHNSPIPCFISIGNHDFHDSGKIYPQFLAELGPLNHAFTIGKTRFVNIDTAASMFPYSSGKRGRMLNALQAANGQVNDTVSFTHRPLHDPIEGSTHDIGNDGERDWLINALTKINSKTLLSGHIHIYDRTEFMGIDNIIAGQGLGHQDIITMSDYSKIVIGHVANDGHVSYSPEPLSMPMNLHCHPRSQSAKDGLLEFSDSPKTRNFLQGIRDNCS